LGNLTPCLKRALQRVRGCWGEIEPNLSPQFVGQTIASNRLKTASNPEKVNFSEANWVPAFPFPPCQGCNGNKVPQHRARICAFWPLPAPQISPRTSGPTGKLVWVFRRSGPPFRTPPPREQRWVLGKQYPRKKGKIRGPRFLYTSRGKPGPIGSSRRFGIKRSPLG